MTSKEKTKFRASRTWKDFRFLLLEERGYHCELCGGKYPGAQRKKLQVHHLDPENYDTLDSEQFALLCNSDHDLVERVSKKVLANKCTLVNKEKWLNLVGEYLPIKAKAKLEEMIKNEKISS